MQDRKERSGVTAIVLAAGMSTRMGSLKQLLRMGEKTLLETVLENLHRSQVDEVILVLGFSAETIQQQVPLGDVRVVINEAFREGMGTSLRVGLSSVDPGSEAALIVLADQPFVQPGTIDQLIEQYHKRKPRIVIPVYKGFRGNPVLLDRSVFPEVMGLTGDIGCRAIFGSHSENILKVSVEDVGVLLDADTRNDFERFQQAKTRGEWGSALLADADLEGREVTGDAEASPARRQLVVVGQEAVARALVQMGSLLHFAVTVVDPLLTVSDLPGADRVLHALDFSRLPMTSDTYVVVASRGRFDEEAVEQALLTEAAYVALVSGKNRVQEILRSLKIRGVSAEKLVGLRAPAGLDIGAESPEEIALSIMAEIVSDRHRRAESKQKATPD